MQWKKFFIPPVAIYAVIFLFISVLVGAKMDADATWVWIVSLVITVVGLILATSCTKPSTAQVGLKYGVAWLVVFVVLDLFNRSVCRMGLLQRLEILSALRAHAPCACCSCRKRDGVEFHSHKRKAYESTMCAFL
jgi:hypothetical protein